MRETTHRSAPAMNASKACLRQSIIQSGSICVSVSYLSSPLAPKRIQSFIKKVSTEVVVQDYFNLPGIAVGLPTLTSISGGDTGQVSGIHPGTSKQIVIEILTTTTFQTIHQRSSVRIRFSVTTIPDSWHITALTGFKKDIDRTNRQKLRANIRLRSTSKTLPSYGTSKKNRPLALK